MSASSHKPSRLKWLPQAAILVVWTCGVFGFVSKLSAERADVLSRLGANTAQTADHEARLRALEKQVSEIAADVRWIRQQLEKADRP